MRRPSYALPNTSSSTYLSVYEIEGHALSVSFVPVPHTESTQPRRGSWRGRAPRSSRLPLGNIREHNSRVQISEGGVYANKSRLSRDGPASQTLDRGRGTEDLGTRQISLPLLRVGRDGKFRKLAGHDGRLCSTAG